MSVRRGIPALLGLLVALTVGVLVEVPVGASAGSTRAAASTWARQLAANRALARSDARKLLAALRLPAGVKRLRVEPHLARANGADSGPTDGRYWAGNRAFWSTSTNPEAIVSYLRRHNPPGSAVELNGVMTNEQTDVVSREITFTWAQLRDSVYDRTLSVWVITPPSGSSAIVAQSSSAWIVPRRSDQLILTGARAVAIHLRIVKLRPGNGEKIAYIRKYAYVVWRRARVTRLVRYVNWMPMLLPGSPGTGMSCVLNLGPRYTSTVTLDFRTGRRGRTLARAEVEVQPGRDGSSGQNSCDPVELALGHRPEIDLTSRTFVTLLGRLIGHRIS